MERRPADLSDRTFDVVVIGGGVLGACVARDAALRGLQVALVEREDFASVTSRNSLKVLHGGLRHLQHLDLPGMRRSVHERSVWLRIAPHLIDPLPIVVPLYGGVLERTVFSLALRINDLLSADRNHGLLEERRIEAGGALSREQVLELLPQLESAPFKGGIRFHDARMYSSERLVLAVVQSAAEAGAVVVNHASCEGPLSERGQRVGVRVIDRLGGGEIAVRAKVIVNASGPGAAARTASWTGLSSGKPAALSLAWNLVLPDLGADVAFTLPGSRSTPTGSGGAGPRRLFVVPWRGRTMLGTGHAPFRGDPSTFEGLDPDHPAVRDFLEEVGSSWPGPPPTVRDALLVHAGLLPADSIEPTDHLGEVRLSRRPFLHETSDGGVPVLTATTVKFTTSRRLAERAVDRACRHLGHAGVRSVTATTPLPGAPRDAVDVLRAEARAELAELLPEDVIEHLVRCHGTRYLQVVHRRHEDPRWAERVESGRPVIRAQLWHAVRSEMACTPEDLLMRRTELGARGPVTSGAREAAERVLDDCAVSRREVAP